MFAFTRSIAFRALMLGVATGFRSQVAGGTLALNYDEAPRGAGWRRWPALRSTWGRRGLMAATAGELIGDKLPFAQSRLEPGPLAGRLVLSTLAGAAIGSEGSGKASLVRGAVAGMLGGVIGNVGGYHARKTAVDVTGLPDPAVAVVEDLAAISLANRAVTRR